MTEATYLGYQWVTAAIALVIELVRIANEGRED